MVVLAVGLEAQPDAPEVRRLFNITCSNEGFFLERHPKLAPVNTFTDGIFLAGCCQGPKDIPDTVAQAGAAAAEALALIDAGTFELEPNTAYVLEEDCSGCKTLRRFHLLQRVLREMGIEEDRFRLEWISASEGDRLKTAVNDWWQRCGRWVRWDCLTASRNRTKRWNFSRSGR